jgi:DNA-directed RNA polymerase subunit RPC12/RpoP
MYEILKHGKAWHREHSKITCPECYCEFIYGINNVVHDFNYDENEEIERVPPYVKCPECYHKILV